MELNEQEIDAIREIVRPSSPPVALPYMADWARHFMSHLSKNKQEELIAKCERLGILERRDYKGVPE